MLYAEYDWSSLVYRLRFGTTFIDCRGVRSWETRGAMVADLNAAGLKLAKKTDTRTWKVEAIEPAKHGDHCLNEKGEWSGSPNPSNPDNEWICDHCGNPIPA